MVSAPSDPRALLTLMVLLNVISFSSCINIVRYDVAKFLNMDQNDANLDIVCGKLPFDDDWDTSVPLQAAFKDAGLKRFDMSVLRATYSKNSSTETTLETLTGKTNSMALKNKEREKEAESGP